jgi:tetratricopeptide (TPR) repeat protein
MQRQWARCCILTVLGFAVHAPALHGELLWDDDYLVRTNSFIRSPIFFLEVFRHYLLPESYSIHYRPMQNISYMVDYLLWDNNVYGFHLSSVLWHVAAGILIYFLLARLFRSVLATRHEEDSEFSRAGIASWLAFFVALLWIVHPVHSAAVDYISGRADSLAVCLGAGAWLMAWTAQRRSGSRRIILFVLAWITALLALCSRESGCLWPMLFLANFFILEKSTRRGKAVAVGACLILFLTYAGLRHIPAEKTTSNPSPATSASMRAVLMLRALGDYGGLMIFPANLHMERALPGAAPFSGGGGWEVAIKREYLLFAGAALLAALVVLARRKSAGQRFRVFGALWFILAYLPISNLIPLNATVAEHWLYLPSIGFLTFLIGYGLDIPKRWRTPAVVFLCLAVSALSIRSAYRSCDWASNEAFARSTIRSGGLTVRIALLLGEVYSNRGDYSQAEHILRKAVEMHPGYPLAENNLARVLMHLGREKEAQELFVKSVETAPENMKTYPQTWYAALHLSRLLVSEDRKAEAIAVLEKARRDYPQMWELISAESELLCAEGEVESAERMVGEFAHEYWWHYRAHLSLGRLLAMRGLEEAAAGEMRHASWLDVHEIEALNQLVLLRLRENRLAEAWRIQKIAVSRQPDQARQYLLLARVLEKMGRTGEAREELARIDRLRVLASAQNAVD